MDGPILNVLNVLVVLGFWGVLKRPKIQGLKIFSGGRLTPFGCRPYTFWVLALHLLGDALHPKKKNTLFCVAYLDLYNIKLGYLSEGVKRHPLRFFTISGLFSVGFYVLFGLFFPFVYLIPKYNIILDLKLYIKLFEGLVASG